MRRLRHVTLPLLAALALVAEVTQLHAQDAPTRYRVPVTRHEPQDGPANALVTIVAFTDYECPFSARAQATLQQLRHDHPADVRIVHRNEPLPFHPHAEAAAEAAMEAFAQGGDTLFWRYHVRLFADQSALERNKLEAYARESGMNVAALRRALDAHTHADEIAADQLVATAFGANGTPTFFVNGRLVVGAQSYDVVDGIVREEIATAQAAIGRGVPRDQVYAVLVRDGLQHAAPTPAPAGRRINDPSAIYSVPIGSSPLLGRPDALVTVVEFTDMQCPFCRRVQPALATLRTIYGPDVRFVLKHNPLSFHPHARPAARLLVWAARFGKAWPLHDRIFANQTAMDDDDLVADAVSMGLDAAGARAALADTSLDPVIDDDAELATALGATGTPSFFINGRNLRGAQPLDAFRAMIDEELTVARQRVAAGTPQAAVYDRIVAGGLHEARTVAAPPSPSAPPPPDANRVYAIAVPPAAPTRGAAHGRVVVQEFSDFQCPFCGRVQPTITQLLAQYGDRVTFVWRDYPLPFHQNAMPAAEAAREVLAQIGVAAFWRYHDALFAHQQDLTAADLERYASELGGIDLPRFRAAMSSHRHRAEVQADVDAVHASGAQIGTPSFFVDGRLIEGAQPLAAFVTAIERALAY